jgi:hypothetical protein
MGQRFELTWIDKNAVSGPIFQIGRDIYEREIPNGRLIRLKALESYPGHVAATAIEAFRECARAWNAPIVFIIDPNLLKPPAVRFLFEWSRTTHFEGSVEQCFMKTSNPITHLMGKLVLGVFTDGSMPFEAIAGEEKLQDRLNQLDLSTPRPGFSLADPTTALTLAGDAPQGLLSSILSRVFGRAKRIVRKN